MAYTDIDNPELYFQVKAWTGTGNEIAITFDGSENMQPDWVWLKRRDASSIHVAHDSVRGATKRLIPNASNEETTQAQYVKSFDSNGITFGTDTDVNNSGSPAILWGWKAGTSFTNDASATGIGTIDSTGSASDTAGFSIVSYSGTGGAGTIKHGLSTAPSMIIVKVRTGRTSDWLVYHKGIASDAQTDCIKLNETGAAFDEATIWNDTAPTSSVFSVGTEDTVSGSGNTFIAYCFAEKQGYSKFGSYTGNGNADGTFVYTGFKPAFVIIKSSSAGGSGKDWFVWDNKRKPSNPVKNAVWANLNDAENNTDMVDFNSNGFKLRLSSTSMNASGDTYIYMAFAENPLVTSTGVPATAR